MAVIGNHSSLITIKIGKPRTPTSVPPAVPPHLFGMLPEDLAAHLRAEGVSIRDGEARRVLAHAVAGGREGFPRSRPVPRAVERGVTALTDRAPLEIEERATDPADGFVKYLFRLRDGALAEAVRIPLERQGCFTVCLSSQAGCGNANVVRAAEILAHPCGGRIAAKAITISTVGLVPAIHRYALERHPYRLIVSLTSAVDERRRTLMPMAAAWPVRELAGAVRAYQASSGGRATIAWVVLGGINTGVDEVEALRELFAGVPLRLNLIDVNDARPDGFRRAGEDELARFRDALRTLGIPVVRRYSGGAARHAACGMLAGTVEVVL